MMFTGSGLVQPEKAPIESRRPEIYLFQPHPSFVLISHPDTTSHPGPGAGPVFPQINGVPVSQPLSVYHDPVDSGQGYVNYGSSPYWPITTFIGDYQQQPGLQPHYHEQQLTEPTKTNSPSWTGEPDVVFQPVKGYRYTEAVGTEIWSNQPQPLIPVKEEFDTQHQDGKVGPGNSVGAKCEGIPNDRVAKSSPSKNRNKRRLCIFCKSNREPAAFYSSHTLKDENNRTVCPILRMYVCPVCQKTGDEAHTVKYCSMASKEPKSNNCRRFGKQVRNSVGGTRILKY